MKKRTIKIIVFKFFYLGLLIFVILILLYRCTTSKNKNKEYNTTISFLDKTPITINFVKYPENVIKNKQRVACFYLPVEIYGKEYRFVFDTGAEATGINYELFDSMGISCKDSAYVKGFIFNKYEKMASNVPLYIGNLKCNIGKFFRLDIPDDYYAIGVIGMDVIEKCCWLFNLKTGLLQVADTSFFNEKKADLTLKMYQKRTKCSQSILRYTNLNINGCELKNVVIDTGMIGLVIVEYDSIKKKPIYRGYNIKFIKNDIKSKEDILCYGLKDPIYNKDVDGKFYYMFQNTKINGMDYGNLSVCIDPSSDSTSHTYNNIYLSSNFFIMQFDRMYYNPFDNYIKLYRD